MNNTPWSEDKMNRRGVAKFITNYLDKNNDVKVLNINAPWGAGKTFFLTNWKAELSETRACIYFNAWENDYCGDPFIALTSHINDALKALVDPVTVGEIALADFRAKASKLIVSATPIIAKGILKRMSGVDLSDITDVIEQDSVADAASAALEKLLDSNKQTLQTVQEFKSKFSELALAASNYQAVANSGLPAPLYIFIDELDRCRPTYAIELLERIKHFFDIANCKFIIATDTEQLKHSIGAIYGTGFESGRYLKRFFDVEYVLRRTNLEQWISTLNLDFKGIPEYPIATHYNGPHHWSNETIAPDTRAIFSGEFQLTRNQIIILALTKTFRIKPRELEKCLQHLRAVYSTMQVDEFDLFWAAYLIFLKDEAPDYYMRLLEQYTSQVIQELALKYPPAMFYTRKSNINVHELFGVYLSCFFSDQKSIAKRLSDIGDTLLTIPLWSFNSNFEKMRMYPEYVELAVNIN